MTKVLRLVVLAVLSFPLWTSVVPQAQPQPLLGYAVGGRGGLYILDLTANSLAQTVAGPIQAVHSTPKFGPGNEFLYISDSRVGVHVFDVAAQQFSAQYDISGSPSDMEILPGTTTALLNDFDAAKVYVLDLKSGSVLGEISFEGVANEIAVAPDGKRAYVTTYNYNEAVPHAESHPVVVLDVEGRKVITSIPVEIDEIPYVSSSVDVSADGKNVYVLALNDFEDEAAIFVIDTNELKVTDSIKLKVDRPRDPLVNILVRSADGKRIYVAAFENGLWIVDLETKEFKVVKPKDIIGASILGVTVMPDGKTIYATGLAGSAGVLVAFDAVTGQERSQLTLPRRPITFMAVPGARTF